MTRQHAAGPRGDKPGMRMRHLSVLTPHSMVLREQLSGEKKVKTKPEQLRPFIDALWIGVGSR